MSILQSGKGWRPEGVIHDGIVLHILSLAVVKEAYAWFHLSSGYAA